MKLLTDVYLYLYLYASCSYLPNSFVCNFHHLLSSSQPFPPHPILPLFSDLTLEASAYSLVDSTS